MRLLFVLFLQELFSLRSFREFTFWVAHGVSSPEMASKRKCAATRAAAESVAKSEEISVLGLPELALECVLENLLSPPLCIMVGMCRELKDRSNYLWKRHMGEKWGAMRRNGTEGVGFVLGFEEGFFRCYNNGGMRRRCQGAIEEVDRVTRLHLASLVAQVQARLQRDKQRCPPPRDSVISWYISLESDKFWFPAQVYNRKESDNSESEIFKVKQRSAPSLQKRMVGETMSSKIAEQQGVLVRGLEPTSAANVVLKEDTMARRPVGPEEVRWMSHEVHGYVEAILNSLTTNVAKMSIIII